MEIYLANNFILLFIHNYLVSYIIYRKKTIEYISNFLNMILEKLPLFFRSDSSITECLRDDLVRELVKSKRVDFFFLLIDFNQQSGGRQCAAAKKWFKNPISQLECTYFNSTVWQKL